MSGGGTAPQGGYTRADGRNADAEPPADPDSGAGSGPGADRGPALDPSPEPLADPDPVDRSPTRTSAAISLLAAVLAVGIAGGYSQAAALVAVPGVPLVGFGLYTSERRWIGYGAVALVTGVALAGAVGAGPRVTVPAALCAVLAWDAGGYAITLGEQLGRAADTARAELVHVALTIAVGTTGALVGAGAYLVAADDRPALAVVLLFAGALALLAALRSRFSVAALPE